MSTRKVSKGEQWRPDSHDDHNIKARAADAFRRGVEFTPDREHPIDPCRIWVKNTSGAARRQFECLELGTEVNLKSITAEQLYLTGIATTDCAGPFGVLLQPAGIDKWRRAQVSGTCPALVNVVSTSHTRAYLPSGEYVLKSAKEGPVAIVQHPEDTGEQTCLILFHVAPVKVKIVRATECAKPGETKNAVPQKWDEVAGDYVDVQSNGTPDTIAVVDPLYWRLALPGEKFAVERVECSESYRPAVPHLPPRRVEVSSEIACNASGNVTVLRNDSEACTWAETDPVCTVNACNTSNRKIACDVQTEKATLHWTPGEKSGWLVPDERARLATATLAADMCATSATLTGFAAVDVCEWTPYPEVTEADNPLQLYGCAGQTVMLGWDDAACKWIVMQVQPIVLPTGDEPIVQFRCDPSEGFQYRKLKGQIAVQWCGDCQESEWITPTDMMVDVDVPSGNITYCGKTPDTAVREGTQVTGVDCVANPSTVTFDIQPPTGAKQLYLTGVSCAAGPAIENATPRFIWIDGINAPGATTVNMPEMDECGEYGNCVVFHFQWYDDASPEEPVGEPFQIGADLEGICCDDELDPEDPAFEEHCHAEMPTTRHRVLGCSTGQSGTPIALPMHRVDVIDPDGTISYDPILGEGEEVIGCKRTQPTISYCLLGCEIGTGEPITENLTRIDPMTQAELGIEGVGEDAEICLYPHKTPIYALAGCEQDEEPMEKSCVPCDCKTDPIPGQSLLDTLGYEQDSSESPLEKIILNGRLVEHVAEDDVEAWHLGFQWREEGAEEWNTIGWTLYDGPTGVVDFDFSETLTSDEHGLVSGGEQQYEYRAIGVDDIDNPNVIIYGATEVFSLT